MKQNVRVLLFYSHFFRQGHEGSSLFEHVPVQDNEVTHIFSLASGHLYERFLKIMMLSTRNHTTGPVKFWILSNFLSPSFKVLFFTTLFLFFFSSF